MLDYCILYYPGGVDLTIYVLQVDFRAFTLEQPKESSQVGFLARG